MAGAVLILFDGVVLLAAGNLLANAGFYDASQFAGAIGLGALVIGFLLVLLTIILYREPESSLGLGIGILILSLLAILTGGGFILGTILGAIGGVAAILRGASCGAEDGIGTTQPMPPPPGWNCPRCHHPNSPDAWFCAQCGHDRPKAGPAGLW